MVGVRFEDDENDETAPIDDGRLFREGQEPIEKFWPEELECMPRTS